MWNFNKNLKHIQLYSAGTTGIEIWLPENRLSGDWADQMQKSHHLIHRQIPAEHLWDYNSYSFEQIRICCGGGNYS